MTAGERKVEEGQTWIQLMSGRVFTVFQVVRPAGRRTQTRIRLNPFVSGTVAGRQVTLQELHANYRLCRVDWMPPESGVVK